MHRLIHTMSTRTHGTGNEEREGLAGRKQLETVFRMFQWAHLHLNFVNPNANQSNFMLDITNFQDNYSRNLDTADMAHVLIFDFCRVVGKNYHTLALMPFDSYSQESEGVHTYLLDMDVFEVRTLKVENCLLSKHVCDAATAPMSRAEIEFMVEECHKIENDFADEMEKINKRAADLIREEGHIFLANAYSQLLSIAINSMLSRHGQVGLFG